GACKHIRAALIFINDPERKEKFKLPDVKLPTFEEIVTVHDIDHVIFDEEGSEGSCDGDSSIETEFDEDSDLQQYYLKKINHVELVKVYGKEICESDKAESRYVNNPTQDLYLSSFADINHLSIWQHEYIATRMSITGFINDGRNILKNLEQLAGNLSELTKDDDRKNINNLLQLFHDLSQTESMRQISEIISSYKPVTREMPRERKRSSPQCEALPPSPEKKMNRYTSYSII
ncbi:1330_t:CDS:1, partial [Ambispora gerdemannii]